MNEYMKAATFVVCPWCDEAKCVGRHNCPEIAARIEKKKQEERTAEIKPCPILVASPRMEGTLCMQEHCAWWSKYAKCCSIPIIADILADSTICQSIFAQEVGSENE